MTTWSYAAFESNLSGRAGITELEHCVSKKLEELELRAEYAKVAMSNIIDSTARALIYYPETVIALDRALTPVTGIGFWKSSEQH